VIALEQPPRAWQFPVSGSGGEGGTDGVERPVARAGAAAPVTDADLEAITRFETAAIALRDGDGWPISVPVEIEREAEGLHVSLPDTGIAPAEGPASLLGHTWTKDGPRYLALTGRSAFRVPSSGGIGDNPHADLTFAPSRAMRRL
jgi:hypothetical protein